MSILEIAVQRNDPIEKLTLLMDLQERWEGNEAKKAYFRAMAMFKANPPEILKTAHVSFINSKNQKVEWDHAKLGEICEAVNVALAPQGLFATWTLEQPDSKTVKVGCVMRHAEGHSEEISSILPLLKLPKSS